MDGPRPVRREEENALADLLAEVFGFDKLYSHEHIRSGLRRRLHRRGGRIVAEDGKPVSHILTVYHDILVCGARVKVASLGGVGTLAAYRNRGYAGAILQHSIAEMVSAGAKVLIVSGDRSLYRRNHCVPAGHAFDAEVQVDDSSPSISPPVAVRKITPEDWPLLAPLHQAEPVRFIRPADFLSRACFWWDCGSPEIWLVERDGSPVSYLSLVPPWRGEDREVTRSVFEYAGSRAALVDSLPLIGSAIGVTRFQFRVLGWDTDLIYLLGQRGLALRPSRISGTLRLLDLPGLMRRLRPFLAARLAPADLRRLSFHQQGETCVFALGSEKVELSLSQAAPLVLGGPDAPALSGDLGRLLAAIFPIPLPRPGFNYV